MAEGDAPAGSAAGATEGAVDAGKATVLGAAATDTAKPEGSDAGAQVELTEAQTAAQKLLSEAKTPEAKTAAEKAVKDADTAAEQDKTDAKPGAPETYRDFKMPEGFTLDADLLAEVTPVFKEQGFNQKQAQALVDFHAKFMTKQLTKQHESWETLKDGWLKDAKGDTEIGGEKFDENVGFAKKALVAFGTPKLIEAMNSTGAGNQVEFIRFCAKVGRLTADDKLLSGGQPAAEKKTAADRIFNNTP